VKVFIIQKATTSLTQGAPCVREVVAFSEIYLMGPEGTAIYLRSINTNQGKIDFENE
jgi:hypothetical protein